MSQSLLGIFERSGDANVGQTLLRLASLAQAAHQLQAIQRPMDPLSAKAPGGEGIAAGPVDPSSRMDAGTAHQEVDR